MKPRRLLALSLVLAVCFAVVPRLVAQGEPAVLDQLSESPALVLAIPNLNVLNERVRIVANTLWVTVPEMVDLLAQAKSAMGLTQGINDDGGFALVLTRPTLAWWQDAGPPPVVMILPVSDAGAFLRNFGDDAEDVPDAAGLKQVQLPGKGATGYLRMLDGHAVLGPDMEVVKSYQAARAGAALVARSGALGRATLERSQAFVYVDVRALKPALTDLLTEGRLMMQTQFEATPAAAMALNMLAMYFDAAEAVVNDTDTLLLGLGADELGMSLSKSLALRPGSELAGCFRAGGPAQAQLDRLPDQPYLVALAADLRCVSFTSMAQKMIARFEQSPETAFMAGVMKPMMPIFEKAIGYAQVMNPIDLMGAAGGNPFAAVTILQTEDAPGAVAAYRQALEALNTVKLKVPLPPAPGEPFDPNAAPKTGEISYNTLYTPNALQIDGQGVDQYTVRTVLPPQMLQGNPMAPMLGGMMAMGTTGYITATDRFLVMTTTPDAAAIHAVLDSVKRDKGLGSATMVAQVRQQLTPAPAFESYLNIASLLGTVNLFAGMMGMPAVAAPQDLPPVAMSVSTGESAVAGRVYVPLAVVKAIKEMAQQFEAAGAAPRPPRQPGDGPPPPPIH